MAISRQHAYLIAPAVVAELFLIYAIFASIRMVADVEPELRPPYAQDLGPWILWIGFWHTLRFGLTMGGLLITRARLWWLPIAALAWEFYIYVGAVRVYSEHVESMFEYFTLPTVDILDPIFLPFTIATLFPFVLISILGLRSRQLFIQRRNCPAI